MNIDPRNGLVSVINFSPFDGSKDDHEQRNRLIERASQLSGSFPENRLDVFDETFFIFSDSVKALDFLVEITAVVQLENFEISLRTGLCFGEFFTQKDHIYGDAINMSTRLSCSSRENEILVCSKNCREIEEYIKNHNNLSYYCRDQETYSISLLDEDCTQTNSISNTVKISFAGNLKVFQTARNRKISIGRYQGCDIFIDSDQVSRAHATITLNFDTIFIEDHSSNGTYLYVNDEVVYLTGDSMQLPPTGEIYFGRNRNNAASSRALISYELCEAENTLF